MIFKKYPKIYRLGTDETEGILDGVCYIQEKIDGANASIWKDENGEIQCGSRNRHLVNDDFNGFVTYVKNHQGILNYLNDYPRDRLYGEWLVKHTIKYNDDSYHKFYLFDIEDDEVGFNPTGTIREIAEEYGINTPKLLSVFARPSIEDVKQFVGQTTLGDVGEGVVIKNLSFINKFGNMCYAKLVSDSFKEDNSVIFNSNFKEAESYNEMYVVNKYMTLARVKKVCDKLQPEINEPLDMKHIPRITMTCYHDMLTEEIWEISKKIDNINFKTLKTLAAKKSKHLYVTLLENKYEA